MQLIANGVFLVYYHGTPICFTYFLRVARFSYNYRCIQVLSFERFDVLLLI